MSGTEQEARGAHAAAPPPGPVPHSLGKYRFVATLGHGGMADVFLAAAMGPAGFHKLQVVKRLRPHLAEDPDLAAMFLDEARLAARLNHRNVVQTNEVDLIDGQYFMAMEYLDGQPLHRVVAQARKAGRRLPPALIARIVCDALTGLHYAHDLADYDGLPLGVVHRDVSPQNIFVTYDGQVKIVDFGIAKTTRRAVDTAVGVIKGKVAYMAPEQAFGDVDRRADVFSMGVVLWELCADRRLWGEMSDPEILTALVHDVPRLASERPGLDPELYRITDRALALDREDRYATAASFRADLERAVPPAPAEDLGAFVESLFHEPRQRIREALARQVDLVAQGEGGDLLELDRSDRASFRPPSLRPPRAGSLRPISDTPSSETPAPSTLERLPGTSHPPPSLPPPTSTRPRGPSRTSIVLGTLLAIVAGASLVRSLDRPEPPAAAPPGPAIAPTPQAPTVVVSPLPGGAYVQVHLGASPPEARILVDGAALPSNPFDGKFVKDGAVHRVQVEAPGFSGQSRIVVFDKDVSFELALSPRPKAGDPPGMKPDPYR